MVCVCVCLLFYSALCFLSALQITCQTVFLVVNRVNNVCVGFICGYIYLHMCAVCFNIQV